ncbi:hypothetical protein BJY04DRAFT_214571 [Aspergillus karnatakaensis]|uniref:uncharacterized protein n=1 Tax=Aspergillus karnatakaensis TaxID=1810916 RepID=UPI003CCCD6FB
MASPDQHSRKPSRTFGLKRLYPDSDDLPSTGVDVVAIHGLGTKSSITWGAYAQEDSGPDGPTVNWLRDPNMLPSILPDARILTYDYDAEYYKDAPVQSLLSRAEILLKLLMDARMRDGSEERPIIFIASCFGGILLVKALVEAGNSCNVYRPILYHTAGIIFLATPLRGSAAVKAASWRVYVAGIIGRETSDDLIKDLDGKSGVLSELVQKFAKLAYKEEHLIQMHCFTRCAERTLREPYCHVLSLTIVEENSACLDGVDRTALEATHAMMNKFRGPDDNNYRLVIGVLREFADRASDVIKKHHNYQEKPKNVHWAIPRATNSLFTGRKNELKEIISSLISRSPSVQTRFVITGIGGQGKSELCLVVANELRNRYWGVFWVDVSDSTTAEAGFYRISMQLGSDTKTAEQVLKLLAACQEGWLLILDNADNFNIDYQYYIPPCHHGTVLITTRNEDFHIAYSTAGSLALDILSPTDACEILLKAARVPLEEWEGQSETARSVVSLLGYHVLAIIQAGAYIARRGWRLGQYTAEYERHRQRVLGWRLPQAQSRYGSVYSTFEVSAAIISNSTGTQYTDAMHLLKMISMIHYSLLPISFFEVVYEYSRDVLPHDHEDKERISRLTTWHVIQLPGFLRENLGDWDSFRLDEAISVLASCALITRTDTGISMHPLVHAWAKDRLTHEELEAAWISAGSAFAILAHRATATFAWMPSFFYTHQNDLMAHLSTLMSHGEALKKTRAPSRAVAQIEYRCCLVLRLATRKKHGDTQAILDRLLSRLGEQDWSNLPLDLTPAGKPKISSLTDHDEYEAALTLCSAIDGIEGATYPETRDDRLETKFLLGTVYNEMHQYDKAKEAFTRVADTYQQAGLFNHPTRLLSLKELATISLDSGNLREAQHILEVVMEVEGHLSYSWSHHARSLTNLSLARICLRLELPQKAVRILKILSKANADNLIIQRELVKAYFESGQLDRAEALLVRVVQSYGELGELQHPDTFEPQCELALRYMTTGKSLPAIPLLENVANKTKGTRWDTDENRKWIQEHLAQAREALKQTRIPDQRPA